MIRPSGHWKKSSYSESGACVEVVWRGAVRVRDSKGSSPAAVEFSAPVWRRFIVALQAGSSLP
ncbi:DUF397 domain-containing protein [Streptomyces sp. NPDC127038]|uniref:DUF397 domain-containing protein n=1 Tax=Streptomyces sp. NPDC127038 TaxID=3347114 RepID=UPI003655C309